MAVVDRRMMPGLRKICSNVKKRREAEPCKSSESMHAKWRTIYDMKIFALLNFNIIIINF